jgi:glycyl-tRNA synthetase beta chain
MKERSQQTLNFLLEIGTEEIPAFYIPPVLEQLKAAGKSWAPGSAPVAWGTPRRLLLFLPGLPRYRENEVWGPPLDRARDAEGRWNQAASGFAQSRGKKAEDLTVGDKNGKKYVKLLVRRETGEEIAGEIPGLIQSLAFPKSMRWVEGSKARFARPVRWLVCLWGRKVLRVEAAGLKAGRQTLGHRFFGRGPWTLKEADLGAYERLLQAKYVLVDPEKRRETIVEGLLAEGRKHYPELAVADFDSRLIDEVCFLVEYPKVLVGSFEERFLTLPPEVLVTPMQSHQRYFPIRGKGGNLLPCFLFVANGPFPDGEEIARNNARVLRARLADAEFFWKEDCARPLADRVEKLKGVVFHQKLGSYFEKARRLSRLAPLVAGEMGMEEEAIADVSRAALLAKADLATAMVTEFTELQGTMGRRYALASGEKDEVARAIGEHYSPRLAAGELPESRPGIALALADRLDTVAAFVSAGILPSGSQDPFALRRSALGAIRILMEKDLPLSLSALAREAIAGLNAPSDRSESMLRETLAFFQSRLQGYLEGTGVPADISAAVLASGWDDLRDVKRRIQAVRGMQGTPTLLAATTVAERTCNIVRSSRPLPAGEVRADLFREKEEKGLHDAYLAHAASVREAIGRGDYRGATEAYARAFSRPLHDFFDKVMVNVEDEGLRLNRLRLLDAVNRLYADQAADLSLLQFERGEHLFSAPNASGDRDGK